MQQFNEEEATTQRNDKSETHTVKQSLTTTIIFKSLFFSRTYIYTHHQMLRFQNPF